MQSYHEQNILTRHPVAIAAVLSVEDSQTGLLEDPQTGLLEDPQTKLLEEEAAIQPIHLPFFYLCWQKALDILFGLISLLLLLILFPFLALLIYLDSPGPIFFHQERVGYCGQKFLMHKFRSMRPTTEQAGPLLWKTAGDQRVTRIGRFMRATHLDELPQVINILRGEMTLIGPRPERPEYVAELAKSNSRYRYRLGVKPGLTGWAQVNYGYGNSFRDDLIKLQYDLHYIENRSIKLDLFILMKTVMEVVRHRGDQ